DPGRDRGAHRRAHPGGQPARGPRGRGAARPLVRDPRRPRPAAGTVRPAAGRLLRGPAAAHAGHQLLAPVLRPARVVVHPAALRALLHRRLLPGRAGRHPLARPAHHGGLAAPGLPARLSPGPHPLALEAAADRVHPVAAAGRHRDPLLRLDDPPRRPRPHQREPGARGLARPAAAPHVQQVRRHGGAGARVAALHGAVAHRRPQAHRAAAARGVPDPRGLPAPRVLRGDPAALPARHPGRLPAGVLPRDQLVRGADPGGRLQGARAADGGVRPGAVGVRLAVRGRQRLRPAGDLGGADRGLHQGHRARAAGDRVILRGVVALVYAFLLLPMVIVVLAAFNAGNYFTFPPQGFSLKWFANFFARREFMQALRLSAELAAWTALASTVIGTAAAIPLVRGRFRGRDLLNAFVTSPLLLPQILTGVALLQFYTLLKMQASYAALLIGHIVVTTPYVIRTVTATLTHFDLALEEAAQSLGAHPVRAFFEVTLGVIKPGVVAGAIFAFAISFDNFTLSLFLTSSKLTPLPIELFAY